MPDIQSPGNLQEFEAVAEEIVREARSVVTTRLAQGFTHRMKDDGSFVTDVDTAVEDRIRSRIGDAFPDHRILGEERGEDRGESDHVWVIDPIDGTRSLRHRIPLFGTLLALRHRGRSILGLIDLPLLDRIYVAAAGRGARCNGRLLYLSDVSADAVPEEVIGIGERRQFVSGQAASVFDSLMRAHGSVRTYCDCFGHAMAAEGSLGAMVDYDLRIWDVAATEVIIREAGGAFVRVNRSANDSRPDRHDVVFGKPTVVRWILETIGVEAEARSEP